MLRTLWRDLLDLIYPEPLDCVYCGQPKKPGDYELCASCVDAIEFISSPACQKCGKPVWPDLLFCGDCAGGEHRFHKAVPVGVYRGWLKDALYAFKFSGHIELAKPFARLMAGRINQAGVKIEGIVPVPMHAERLRRRHYNHALLLAGFLGDFLKTPVWGQALTRVVDTPPLRTLKREERKVILRQTFVPRGGQAVRDKQVLLVDDIYTTGFTAAACSAALLQAGAREVHVGILAIGLDKSRNS